MPTGVNKDDRLIRRHLARSDVSKQGTQRLTCVDGIQQDSLGAGHGSDRLHARRRGDTVALSNMRVIVVKVCGTEFDVEFQPPGSLVGDLRQDLVPTGMIWNYSGSVPLEIC